MKRGFTLIELLAVIVILAIIALIAVPIVLNIISDTKRSSEEESLKLYQDFVQKAITRKQLSDPNFKPDKCNIKSDGNLECFKGITNLGTVEIEMKGQTPSDGTIIINEKNVIYENIVLNGKTYYEKQNPSFKIGDKVSYNNVMYYVIEDSDSSDDIVKLLKENFLTADEISEYSIGLEVPTDGNGGIIYGINSNYETSYIKNVVDNWKITNASGANIARLLSKDEIEIETEEYKPCGDVCGVVEIREFTKYDWLHDNNYKYWLNTPNSDDTIWFVLNNGRLNYGDTKGGSGYGLVRPVIELNKSSEITKLES